MSTDPRAATPAVIARCRSCRGITYAAVVDDAHPVRKKEIAALVANGADIEHVTVGDVRVATFCSCPKRRRGRHSARTKERAA